MLGGKSVCGAIDLYAALRSKYGCKTLGVIKAAAGIAAAVQIQYDAVGSFVNRRSERNRYPRMIYIRDNNLFSSHFGHNDAKPVLTFAYGLD